MSYPLTVTVTSMTTTPQFRFNNDRHQQRRPHQQNVDSEDLVKVQMASAPLSNSYSNQIKTIMISPPAPVENPHEIDPMERRTVPIRKQSVFVAPSGISSIRAERTSSRSRIRTSTTLTNEDISQRIAKLIQENTAIVEANLINNNNIQNYHRRSSTNSGSTRNALMSNYLIPTYQYPPLRRHSSNDHHVIIQPDDLNSNSTSSYSKLQSALLGDKLIELTDQNSYLHQNNYSNSLLIDGSSMSSLNSNNNANDNNKNKNKSDNNINDDNNNNNNSENNNDCNSRLEHQNNYFQRNYGENALCWSTYEMPPVALHANTNNQQQQSVFPSLFQHSQHPKPSVIINPKSACQQNHSNQESYDPKSCLVRNLLLKSNHHTNHMNNSNYPKRLSSTSPPNFDSPNQVTKASNESQTDQTCIIKDLLLKSPKTSLESSTSSNGNNFSVSDFRLPPRKRSRNNIEVSVRNENNQTTIQQSTNVQQQQSQSYVHTCQLCLVQFRNEQNLEIHQKYYCCGQQNGQQQQQIQSQQTQSETKPIRERKVSVLERPSIINYSNNSITGRQNQHSKKVIDDNSRPSMDDKNTRSSEEFIYKDHQKAPYNFGNILKSKLLSGYDTENETVNDYEEYKNCPHHSMSNQKQSSLKKRKISEPAFRCYSYNQYESKRESTVKQHRASVLSSSKSSSSQETFPLEIIPAYMPYLARSPTKITLKGPILFPVLQNLVDKCTNHEFVVEDNENDDNSCDVTFIKSSTTKETTKSKLLVNQDLEIIENEQIRRLLDDLIAKVEQQQNSDADVINKCVIELIDAVERKNKESLPAKEVVTPQRPTTLDLRGSRNQLDNDTFPMKHSQLIPSTLVSPDTPRSKRKYQQLFLNGNAYSNLGLKVSLRPTYCCIYRLQPMFVMQEANPQLSMYSQWATHPIPQGDVLETLKSPDQLLSAYDSQEAVFVHSHSRRSKLIEQQQQQQQVTHNETKEKKAEAEAVPSTIGSMAEFLAKSKSRLNHIISAITETQVVAKKPADNRIIIVPDRSLKVVILPRGEGFVDRLSDTITRSHFILTHSSYQQSNLNNQSNKHRKSRVIFPSLSNNNNNNNMGLCSVSVPSIMSTNTNSNNIEMLSEKVIPQRKRSSNNSSLSASTLNPYLTMHPMLGHLPSKSKHAVMYIMMMSQTQPVISVPSVPQIMSATTKNLASRKFSDCIGLRQNVYDHEQSWRFSSGSQDINSSGSLIPKRIKIFEGGFKSNEDYTYIRGRGRGKYICGECGIRCKKPSMLKKHIRTHTDLRPYSCRYCAFAFKTKGNLTKHMKSKAHHKKCVELGIIPVPTSIDDSQIDIEALTKQEQYELSCNGSNSGALGSLNQFGDEDDEEYDDDDVDDDEDDDEGVPIPMIEQTRLTYIEPGQFDDAEDSAIVCELENKRKYSSETTSLSSTTTTTTNKVLNRKASTLMDNSICTTSSSMISSNHLSPNTLMSINTCDNNHNNDEDDCHGEDNKKNRIIVVSTSITTTSTLTSTTKTSSNHIVESLPMDDTISNNEASQKLSSTKILPLNQQTPIRSQLPTTSTSTTAQNEIEAEAVRSLLILSAGTVQNAQPNQSDLNNKSHHLSSTLVEDLNNTGSRNNSSLSMFVSNRPKNASIKKSSVIQEKQQTSPLAYVSEIYGHDTAMLKPIYYPHYPDPHHSIESMMHPPPQLLPPPPQQPSQTSNIHNSSKIMEQQQQQQHQYRQTSHPTSVIIANHQSAINASSTSEIELNQRKRIRTTTSTANQNHFGMIESGMMVQPSTTLTPRSSKSNLHSISTLITSTTPTIITTNNNHHIDHHYQQYQQQPSEQKRIVIPTVNDSLNMNSTTQKLLQKIYSNIHHNHNTNQYYNHSIPSYHSPQSSTGKLFSKEEVIDHQHQPPPPPPPQQQQQIRSAGIDVRQTSPTCLPSIVEQSLNRYVASNTSNVPPQSTITMDQDQPIDLSSKKTNIIKPLVIQTDQRLSTNHHSSSLTTSALSSPNKVSPRQHLIEKHHLTEKIVQSLSPFNPSVSNMETNLIPNGHQLYQTLRSEEFTHLTPGIHTPHSLPRNIQNVLMLNRNGGEKTATTSSRTSPTVLTTSSSPTKMNMNTKASASYGEGKPTCPTCMKQFSKPEQLRLHFKIHSFERLFRCESCGVSFRTKGHLQKHARSVSHMNKLNMSITFGRPSTDNPRPFKCSDCKIAFRIHGHLAKHLRSKMHIMKLECLGKLPFGMFAEMERNNINPGLIDTTDCLKALETLQSLAQKLYDPRQMCWKDVDVIEEQNQHQQDEHDDSDSAIIEEEIEDADDCSSEGQHMDQDDQENHGDSVTTNHYHHNNVSAQLDDQNNNNHSAKTSTSQTSSTTIITTTTVTRTNSTISSSLSGTIASTRFNTCYLCGRLFKAAKFLQVHLYCDHPEITTNNSSSNDASNSSTTVASSA